MRKDVELVQSLAADPVQENNTKNSAQELFQYFLSIFDYDEFLANSGLDEDKFYYGMMFFEKMFKNQGEINTRQLKCMLAIQHMPKTSKEIALETGETAQATPRLIQYLCQRGFIASSKSKNKTGHGQIFHVLNQYGRKRLFEELAALTEKEEMLGIKLM